LKDSEKSTIFHGSLPANIDTAILQMTSQTSHYGESQWASLQSAEKTLKEFIKTSKKAVHLALMT